MCEKMKLNGVEKLVPNPYYKRKYVIHIKALKQAIDHGLVLERIHHDGLFRAKMLQVVEIYRFFLHLPKFVCVKAVYPSDC